MCTELWCHGAMILTGDPRSTLREASLNATYFTNDSLWNVVGLNPVLCNYNPVPKRLNHITVTNLSVKNDGVCPDPITEREYSPETLLHICNARRYQNNRSSHCLENIFCFYPLIHGGAKVSWHSVFKMFPLKPRVFFCDTRYSTDESSLSELFATLK